MAPSSYSSYESKADDYFTGARQQFVDRLPVAPEARLLEIGCGNGATAALARQEGRCGYTFGVELCAGPAAEAADKLDEVLVGDIEALSIPADQPFDILILSEVLEHLRDPWQVLEGLRGLLNPGAVVLAGSPNVAHLSVLRMLLRGGWDLTPSGVMDRTHLRWFTPRTYRELFESTGYAVVSVGPARELGPKAAALSRITGGRARHLLHTQIVLEARAA